MALGRMVRARREAARSQLPFVGVGSGEEEDGVAVSAVRLAAPAWGREEGRRKAVLVVVLMLRRTRRVRRREAWQQGKRRAVGGGMMMSMMVGDLDAAQKPQAEPGLWSAGD